MEENVNNNDIFESELAGRYKEELAGEIPDIWDKINSRIDELPSSDAPQKTIENQKSVESQKSAETGKPVLKKKNLYYFYIPAAAAIIILCISVPIFIRIGSKNTATTIAESSAISLTASDGASDDASYAGDDSAANSDSAAYGLTIEGNTNAETAEAEYFAEESAEAVAEEAAAEAPATQENAAESNESRDNGSDASGNKNASGILLNVTVTENMSQEDFDEFLSENNLTIEKHEEGSLLYLLRVSDNLNSLELSGLCKEWEKKDFISEISPAE